MEEARGRILPREAPHPDPRRRGQSYLRKRSSPLAARRVTAVFGRRMLIPPLDATDTVRRESSSHELGRRNPIHASDFHRTRAPIASDLLPGRFRGQRPSQPAARLRTSRSEVSWTGRNSRTSVLALRERNERKHGQSKTHRTRDVCSAHRIRERRTVDGESIWWRELHEPSGCTGISNFNMPPDKRFRISKQDDQDPRQHKHTYLRRM